MSHRTEFNYSHTPCTVTRFWICRRKPTHYIKLVLIKRNCFWKIIPENTTNHVRSSRLCCSMIGVKACHNMSTYFEYLSVQEMKTKQSRIINSGKIHMEYTWLNVVGRDIEGDFHLLYLPIKSSIKRHVPDH